MIRTTITMLALAAALAAQQTKQAPKQTATKQAAAKPKQETKAVVPAKAITIPKDAKEVEPGTFAAKDASGKMWHYRRTPFGVVRFEPQIEKDNTRELAETITAFDDGSDTVRFERKTPFGKAEWKRKKSELNPSESLAWKRASENRGQSAAAKPAKD
ncbi:MAG: hypothetical protein U0Q16_17220 [Bryobacteraceae bacterium]